MQPPTHPHKNVSAPTTPRSAVTYHVAGAATTGAGLDWPQRTLVHRCSTVASARVSIAQAAESFVQACRSEQRTDDVETIASELLPLCAALRWIGRRGARTLQDRRVGLAGRPWWLTGVHSVVRRRPLGTVLIVGAWNYPLLLAGVQAAQALAAGNRVRLKPAPGAEAATGLLIDCFRRAGVPAEALEQLDSSPEAAQQAIAAGVDLIVLTGAATTGRDVLHQAAQTLTPTILELSGADAVIVLPEANETLLARAADALRFGLLFNAGATCIGPRRLLSLSEATTEQVLTRLMPALAEASEVVVHAAARSGVADAIAGAIAAGAADRLGRFNESRLRETGRMMPVVLADVPPGHPVLHSDLFAPVLSLVRCDGPFAAIEQVNRSPYRLAASVFGPTGAARVMAEQLDVGTVTVNDLIAPTADPRLPFGGRGRSGFGVTRGPEGLLAMTTPQVICVRRSGPVPHLARRTDADAERLTGILQFANGRSWATRWAALRRVTTATRRSRPVETPRRGKHP